jgi:hypothetical protein
MATPMNFIEPTATWSKPSAETGTGAALVKAEIWLDRDLGMAARGDQAPDWLPDYSGGLTPGLFYGGAVPMKRATDQGLLALKWYTRALNAGHVAGPPRFRVLLELDAVQAWEHCLSGDIVMRPEQDSILFNMDVNTVNYASLRRITMYDYAGNEDVLLRRGCELLAADDQSQ